MAHPKLSVTRTINRLVVPKLRAAGFTFVLSEDAIRMKDGDYFQRSRNQRREIVRLGPMKFGKALGLNIAAEQADGSYTYMRWHEHGLTPADLTYSTQEELDSALLRVIYFLETHGFAWLDSQLVDSDARPNR